VIEGMPLVEQVERVGKARWWLQAFLVMVYRQTIRFQRTKSRMFNTLVMPLVWFIFFGLGWASTFNRLGPIAKVLFGGLDYLSYLTPGIVLMSAFTGGFASGLTLLFDREFGYLKELLVAPASRTATILGRMLGDSLAATLQATIMLAVLAIATGYTNPIALATVVMLALVTAFMASAMGTTIALTMSSPEGFHGVVNLVILPLIFLSGIFYPIETLQQPLALLATINPLTHTVQLARWAMYNIIEEPIIVAITSTLISTTLFTTIAVLKYRRTYIA